MTFTYDEQKAALEAIGYEIREEFEEEEHNWNGLQSEVRKYKVYNVYRNGENMTAKHYQGGRDRIKWVFENELKKRLLGKGFWG